MLIHRIALFIVFLIVNVFISNNTFAQSDSSVTDSVLVSEETDSLSIDSAIVDGRKRYEGAQILRIGADIKMLVFPFMYPGKSFYEITLDYKYRDKLYPTLEWGGGRGRYDYPHLKYDVGAMYFRLGLDNSVLAFRHQRDFDIAFVGFRYGAAFGNRGHATYSFDSPFGGEFSGEYEDESFFIHWGEVTAGMKLEVLPRIFLGWTGRAKFLFNKNTFDNISPFYIAGYGSADKTTSFDVSFYINFLVFNRKMKIN